MSVVLLLVAMMVGTDGDVPLKELGVTLPETIGELQYKERQEFGGGLGYGVTYANKLCSVSLYVYDRGQKDIPAGKAGRPVVDELKTAAADMAVAEKKGAYKNLKRLDGELPLPEAVLAKFAAAGYTFDVRGGGCKSYLLVTGYQRHFLKLRATQYVIDGKTNDAELDEFLEEVSRHIKEPSK